MNPLDDLMNDPDSGLPTIATKRADKAKRAADLDSELDIDGLDITDPTELPPIEITHHPITGETIDLTDVESVVRNIIETKSVITAINAFDADLRRAAMHLAAGETKTRRLTAMIDGEMQTIEVHMPDDEWPARELAILSAWCVETSRVEQLGAFNRRFIRTKVKTEYSPIKKEVKKLANETFPEGSLLAVAKEKLLAINKGTANKLPRVLIAGEKLNSWDADRFGDGDGDE